MRACNRYIVNVYDPGIEPQVAMLRAWRCLESPGITIFNDGVGVCHDETARGSQVFTVWKVDQLPPQEESHNAKGVPDATPSGGKEKSLDTT